MNKKSYSVIINGLNSYIITNQKDEGSFVSFREAKEELAKHFELLARAYLEKLRELSTATLGEFLIPLSAVEKRHETNPMKDKV